MDPGRQDLIAQFSGITGANPSAAQNALQSADWNLEEAVSLFYAAHDDGQDAPEAYEDDVAVEPRQPSPSASQPTPTASSSTARQPTGGRAKQMTMDDLRKMQEEGDESDGEKKQDMFAGGEKSGLAVQNPGQDGPVDHFRNIMNQARHNRERPTAPGEEQQAPPRSHFTGRAQTLGGDDAESTVVEDPLAATRARQQPLPRVTRTLHLWADGISIDEGPLFRFDDPANQHMMAEINRGHAPLSLLDVQPNQEVDLSLVPHKEENYVAPKKSYKPFSGEGQRLGSPTPGSGPASSTSAPAAAPQVASASSQSSATVHVDEAAPTLQIQIRLGDGTRLQSRFNTTHTIGDVYAFVDRASTASQRPYALMTTFPSKELNDRSLILGDLGDFKRGGVVVQKFLG